LGAVQQFFEALGLTTPPRVEISTQRVQLYGSPGASVETTIHLQAVEKRPVFAHATTSTPWLQIGKIHLGGQKAKIPVRIPSVPATPGQVLPAKIQVTANGNQRFVVELSLQVEGPQSSWGPYPPAGRAFDMSEVMAAAPVLAAHTAAPLEVLSGAREIPPVRTAPVIDPAHVANHVPLLQAVEIVQQPAVAEAIQPARQPRPFTPTPSPAAMPTAVEPIAAPVLKNLGAAVLLLGLVALALLVTLVHDLFVRPEVYGAGGEDVDPNPYIAVQFHDGLKPGDVKNAMPDPSMRFGILMTREHDPKDPKKFKRLTFDDWGRTNNTCLRIDGNDYLFSYAPCAWVDRTAKLGKDASGRQREGLRSTLVVFLPGKKAPALQVAQTVEIVPGEQSHKLDTCLISYKLENKDDQPRSVGIRFLLDTFIGAEDGVPFTIPGQRDLCDTKLRFNSASEVPDYIEALENADLKNPGTVARLQFRLGGNYETPTRVLLCGWPDKGLKRYGFKEADEELTYWSVPFVSMRFLKDNRAERTDHTIAPADSCVVAYWDPKPLQPGETREVGFTYGLGNVANTEAGGKLLLSLGGRLVRDGDLTLTALVSDPQPGEKLSLELPTGVRLAEGTLEQDVQPPPADAARKTSPVTWKLRAGPEGSYTLTVRSNKGASQSLKITIRSKGVFD
jgi:hypothetical protein